MSFNYKAFKECRKNISQWKRIIRIIIRMDYWLWIQFKIGWINFQFFNIMELRFLFQMLNSATLPPTENTHELEDERTPVKQVPYSIQDISKWNVLSTKDYFSSISTENDQK